MRQNTKMKERLSSLGFAMALEPVPNYTQLNSDDFNELESIAEAFAEDNRNFEKSSSNHTGGRSENTSAYPFVSSHRPLKRQRIDSPLPPNLQVDTPSSRDKMPPPPLKPPSKMRSVRHFFPRIRRKLSSSRSPPGETQSSDGDVQMYGNGQWQNAGHSRVNNGHSSPSQDIRSEPPPVSGLLPPENPSQRSHLLASVGADLEASKFTFRASSPVKINNERTGNQPVQLPTAPSYLRLMDGFAHDNRIELGLRDPRTSSPGQYQAREAITPSFSTPQTQRQTQATSSQQRWRPGHVFLHQSSHGSSGQMNDQQRNSPLSKSKGFFSRAHYDSSIGIRTPDRTEAQQPVQPVQNVVSSFFRRSSDAHLPPQPRITETQTSSHHFVASRSPRPPMPATVESHEPGSLNGLSFMNSPLDSRNEPIMYKQYPRHLPTQNHITSGAFVAQPRIHESPHLGGREFSSWAQSRPALFRQQQTRSYPNALPIMSLSSTTPSPIERLPSAMSTTVLDRSALRNRAQWDTLQQAGVRSSRQVYDKLPIGSSRLLSTNQFARVKWRSVRPQ